MPSGHGRLAQLVGMYGTFPEENTSGKDKPGKVLGHCMRKMLHLVFAVWKTDRPFDRDYYPWDQAAPGKKKAAGRNRETEPEEQAVTAANSKVDSGPATVNTTPTNEVASCPAMPAPQVAQVNFEALRRQVSMEQVLPHLGWLADLKARGSQRRGPCPIHASRGERHRSFSVNLDKNLFQCFYPDCGAKGNVLDFWAALHRLPLREAALHLAQTFQLISEDAGAVGRRSPRRRDAHAASGWPVAQAGLADREPGGAGAVPGRPRRLRLLIDAIDFHCGGLDLLPSPT